MSFPKLLTSIDKVDDYTVRFTLTEPQAPFLADLAMDFASILSKEYADALLKQGKPELIDQSRSAPGRSSFVDYQRMPPSATGAFAGLLGAEAEDRRAGLLDQQGPGGAPCQAARQRMPGDGLSRTRPTCRRSRPTDAAGCMQQPGLNIGYLAFNTQKKPFDNACATPLNMAIDKKAIIDAVYQGPGSRRRT